MSTLAIPIIGAVGSLLGGIFGSHSAKAAATTIGRTGTAVGQQIQKDTYQGMQGALDASSQAQGLVGQNTTNANELLKGIFGQQAGALNPYMAVGNTAAANLNAAYQPGGSLSGSFSVPGGAFTAPTAAQVMQTPGYEFQLEQGKQAIARQAASLGQYNSGATAKSLDAYSQGLASTYYQNAFNNSLNAYQTNYQTSLGAYQTNYNNSLNSLLAGANLGLQGTSLYNSAASNYGNLASSNLTNAAQYMGNLGLQAAEYSGTLGLQGDIAAGNSYMQGAYGTAAGQMGSTNAWLNALNGITGAASSFFTPQQQNPNSGGPGTPAFNATLNNLPMTNRIDPSMFGPSYSPSSYGAFY